MSSQILDLRNIVSQKEKEWKEAVEQRLVQLEQDLESKDAVLRDREEKLARVKHDFKFNFKLLKERDAEIAKLEAELSEARRQCHSRDLTHSESAIALDEARTIIKRLRDDKVALVEEMDRHTAAHVSETERLRREHEVLLSGIRADAAARERSLELEVVRLREELEAQRREMLTDVESAMAAKDQEHQESADEMSKRALASELRTQLLEKELEIVRSGRAEAVAKAADSERRLREAETAAEQRAMSLRSEVALRDAAIEEQRQQLTERDREVARTREEAARQKEQLERALGEREVAVKEMQELLGAERGANQQRLDQTCETFEAAQFEFSQVEWRLKEEVKQKALLLENAHAEIATLMSKLEASEKRVTAASAGRDGELRNLRSEVANYKSEAAARREEARRRTEELGAALEREQAAEQARAQLEVDYGRRVEETVEAERERLDALVSGLVAKTNELNARAEAAEASAAQKEMFVQGLIRERDLAVQTLSDNGLQFDRRAELRVPPEHVERLHSLEEQNVALQADVERLRRENVALLTAPGPQDLTRQLASDMKGQGDGLETQKTKKEKRRKEKEKEEKEREKERVKETDIDPNSRHVLDLASNASRLRQERIQLVAQCRKQTTRIQHLESQVDELNRQLRSRLTQVDKLEYEVSSSSRQHTTELEAVRKRVTELEGQLAECRREADEYYKGNLEQARINEGLEQELTLLKARKAPKTPQVNFGAQELLIQQLQDEVEALRSRLRESLQEQGQIARSRTGRGRQKEDDEEETVVRLRAKLKLAAKKLIRLAEENSVLRQMSSHLRATLVKAGLPVPPVAGAQQRYARAPVGKTPRGGGSDHRETGEPRSQQQQQTRLQEMEKLEYAIMRQRMSARSRSHSPPERLVAQNQAELTESDTQEEEEDEEEQVVAEVPRRRLIDSVTDPEASLADLWQQLGELDVGISAGSSQLGVAQQLSVRGRAITPRNAVSRTFGGQRDVHR